jgi:hypothetical protein
MWIVLIYLVIQLINRHNGGLRASVESSGISGLAALLAERYSWPNEREPFNAALISWCNVL